MSVPKPRQMPPAELSPGPILALSGACTFEPPLGRLTLTPVKTQLTVTEAQTFPGIRVAVSYSGEGFNPLHCTVYVAQTGTPYQLASTFERQSDHININWVLGNKLLLGSVNANREHFEMGINTLALGEVMYPGVVQKILTNSVDGLDSYKELMRLLVEEKSALKVYMNVAGE